MRAGQRPTIHRSHQCRVPKERSRTSATGGGNSCAVAGPSPWVGDSLSEAHVLLVACRHQPRKTPGLAGKRCVGRRWAGADHRELSRRLACNKCPSPSHRSSEGVWAEKLHARVPVHKSCWGGTDLYGVVPRWAIFPYKVGLPVVPVLSLHADLGNLHKVVMVLTYRTAVACDPSQKPVVTLYLVAHGRPQPGRWPARLPSAPYRQLA